MAKHKKEIDKFEKNLSGAVEAFLRLRKNTPPPTKWHKDLSKYNRKKEKQIPEEE